MVAWLAVFDASAKFPAGIVFGATHSFGSYDECTSFDKWPVAAQYCLARVQLRPSKHLPWGPANSSAHQAVRTFRHFVSKPLPPKEHEPRIPKHAQDDPNGSVWLKVQVRHVLIEPRHSEFSRFVWKN